jgi:phosphoribosylaminoimidazolecarboxamide formyltransferase/IMP cyclohydrolase
MKVRNVLSVAYDKAALDYLIKNSDINVILIKSPLQEILGFPAHDIKVTPFGYLVQEQNKSKLTKSSFKVCTKTKPAQQSAEDAIFAWKVSKYTKTKSAVIVKDLCVKSISQGYTNGVDAVEAAMDFACENSKDAVLAVDGYIDDEKIINAAIQGRISLIIEAGDGAESVKLAKLADKYGIVLIATGIRNNKY